MKKRLLMLGTGFMQKPAIIAAKELGCEVIAVDRDKNSASASLADLFEPIDLKDTAALVAFAQSLKSKKGLDGVFTAATDFSFAVSMIAQACDLPGHSPEAALNATDKTRMRLCFQKSNVPSPVFFEIDADAKLEDYTQIGSKINFPVVVKPVDNMGARGCIQVQTTDGLFEAAQTAISFSRTQRAIIEEFITGPEFSLEAIIFNGEIYITAIAERHITFAPYFVEMGHTIPADIDDGIAEELCRVFKLGIRSLGLTHGVAKGDIFYHNDHAVVGEIAARLSGGYMSGWTVPYSSGLNITKAAVELSLGLQPNTFNVNPQFFHLPTKNVVQMVSAERAWVSIPGKIAAIHGIDAARHVHGVKHVFPRYTEGGIVSVPKNNVEKAGNVISIALDAKTAADTCKKAIKHIIFRLEPHNTQTETFLKTMHNSTTTQTEYPPNYVSILNTSILSFSGMFAESPYLEWKGLHIPRRLYDLFHYSADTSGLSIKDILETAMHEEPQLVTFIAGLVSQRKNNNHADILLQQFWAALIRGGIQGLLYVYDSTAQ